ncbi:MAG: transglutaminase domain-containing protein [Cyclobacteriaceae bacterium]
MKTFSTLFLLLLSVILYAQKPPIKFGKISDEELKMTEYEGDNSAAAVVLVDFGESMITYDQTYGFQIEFERIRRIKILNKDGYDWANFEIPLYHKNSNEEKLVGLKAVTVNLEGNKAVETKLGKEGIFEEETSENWRRVKITLPNVREGSVIDITYKVTSPFLFNFQDWAFQTTIPIVWSEYNARIPEYFDYQKYSQGYIPFKVNEHNTVRRSITLNSKERASSGGFGGGSATTTFQNQTIEYNQNDLRWVSENVPAFIEEPYMTNSNDYISKMNFELAQIRMPQQPVELVMGTWENINKELLDATEFGVVVKRSNFLNKTVEELVTGKSLDSEKINVIYNYIKSNVQWDGNYRKYTDGNFKKVIDEKRGNSAEINLMLVSMLQKAGLRADPVVISTRNHGFLRRQFPLSSQFNYVICAVALEDKLLLLDGTDRSLPASMLPERCLNGVGLLISENNSRWVELNPIIKTKTVVEANVEFKEDALMGQIQITKDGYDGQRMRNDFHSKGKESYIKSLVEGNEWTVHSSQFENLTNLDEPIKEVYELTFRNESTLADIIYLSPMMGSGIKENPFKAEKREYPVDFGSPFEVTSVIKVKIPDGYVAEELPAPMAVSLPEKGGRFLYNVVSMKGEISLTSMFTISKGIYTQLEYQSLREFYAQAISKQEEQIVLKKAN